MPPTSVHRFVAWTRLGNKSKEQLHRPSTQDDTIPPLPKDGRNAEAADPLPSRDSLDRHSANVGQSNTTPRSNGEDENTEASKDGAIIGEQTLSKAPAHSVGPGNDAVVEASDACLDLPKPSSGTSAPAEQGPPQLKHSKSFFTTFALTKKLRLRKCDPAPLVRTPDKSLSTRMPCSPRQGTHRPQAVPIALPNDIASKERREEALRSLGLLPPRDLSALEADEDRRIDVLRKNTTSPPPSDNSHSDANKIAQSWRNCNSGWLSQSPPNSDTDDHMTESSSSTDASSHFGSLPELVTAGADASDSVPLISSPSITKFLTLASHDSATQPLKAASSRMSQDSVSSHQVSHVLEELALPSLCLGDLLTTQIPVIGVSEDMKTKTASAQSAPSPPVLSKTSCSPHSQDAERPQMSTTSLLSYRSLSPSPSRQPEVSKTSVSPPEVTSEPLVESSPKALAVEPESEPLEVIVAKDKLSVPDLSPLLIFPNVSDTFLASPISPTLSPALCYSPSEVSDITPAVDNGDVVTSRITDIVTIKGRRADITPFADKKSEGAFVQEVIVEGPEPFPDENDLDPFARPMSPSFPTVVVSPPASKLMTRATRATTLGPSTSAEIEKPRSLVGLRRQFTDNLFRRPRARTTVSHLASTDSSPPPLPLDVRVHNRSTIYEEASRIDDDEVRRLSELAFMT